ncbi:MAG: ABC transporter permease [Chitinophagaceae bacterium]|nr:ABC transporter permease [Chitinophagaceae bacterium]
MFGAIFSFELKNGFKKPSTYIFFGILFLLSLMIGLAASGVFSTTRSDSNFIVNSAFSVAGVLLGTSSSIFSILVSVILISIMAVAIQKDYQYNMHPLFFTKPISKSGYFFGRFLGSFTIAVFVFSGLLIGFYLGTLAGMGKPMMAEYKFANYLQPFFIFTVPNILLLGVLFFSLTTFLRTTMMAYIVAIILMVLQIMSNTLMQNIDNKMLSALLEPSGANALNYVTEYWSPFEKNENLIPFTGALLYNRLLWAAIAIVVCAVSYFGFSFSQFLRPLQLFGRKEKADAPYAAQSHTLDDLPAVTQDFSGKAAMKQMWWLGLFEARKMVRSLFFIIMCLLGIGMMLLIVNFMDAIYGVSTYMVTYKIVEDVAGSISLFVVIFIIFYSGTAIWRERETKMDELVGVTPVSNASMFFSKFIGLVLASAVLSLVAMVTGIIIQFYNGYYQIDLIQYSISILRSLGVGVVFIALCLAVQVYSPNKFLGFFLALIPIVILPIVFGLLEWSNDFYDFNSTGSSMPYSDMNGYGGTFTQWPFYRIYWISISAVLCLLALVLYARGKEKSIKSRWRLSSYFNTGRYKLLIVAAVLIAIASGAFIFYQTRTLQVYMKPKERERLTAELEKKYSKYKTLLQPGIIASKVEVDIYPSAKELRMAAVYTLQNKTEKPIDTLYFDYRSGRKSAYSYSKFSPSVPFTVISDDKENGIKLIKLNKPMLPGDSIEFAFDMMYKPRGLFDKMNSDVAGNGTFINNTLMPSLGYNEAGELSQNRARKEYGLPPKPRMAKVNDSAARMNNYISNDADWIKFEATVSTDEGQIAIAPGYLQKEWTKDGRHYFQYKMNSPILNFYSFLSAAYQVKKDKWNGVNIEIYYQKGHEYNLERMVKGIKKSLDYYTVNFGPYQHRQVRIMEFPRIYGMFAQSFPNSIPFSEAIGFITKVEEGPDKIDVPFYITAHEVAHQWWAHQVIGGNVQGSVLMSETMSQYSALMVMEKEYGKEAMKKFLKYEMDKYLMGRTIEGKGELPLMLTENQQYIHYNKGSVIMYALRDFLGEDTLNAAIRAYLNKTKFSGPLYTNSEEFVAYIRQATPDSLQYLVTDMFEKITLYENYMQKLDYKQLPDKTYKVTLTVGSAKFYSDSIGKQTTAPVNDYMDVGVFATTNVKGKETEKQLILQRIKMDKPEKTFEFIVKEKPVSAGIDPYHKLIDRTPKNNTYKFGQTPEKPNLKAGSSGPVIQIGN